MARNQFQGRHYPECCFGGFTRIDGTIAFYQRVNALLRPDATVLDVGCGRAEYAEDACAYRRDLRILKGKVDRVIGIDVDSAGQENPCIDEFRPMEDTARWPVDDESVDLVLADFVLEHVAKPQFFFQECWRVLRGGGAVCVRTPNVFNYFGIASRLIHNRHHSAVLRRVQDGRNEEDVFPTLYRCNSFRAVRHGLAEQGFEPCVYGWESEPAYLSFNGWAYWLGAIHAKFAPECMKLTLFGFGRKP